MGEWPLVGRSTEIERLRAIVTDPEQRGVLLVAPMGAGKTRLARECVEFAREGGMHPVWITATRSASGLPLGVLAPLLPAGQGPVVSSAALAHVLRGSAAALVAPAGDGRLALFVDDANFLDDVSAALVCQLVTAGHAFFVGTVRSGATSPDAVVALWKDRLVERIDVEGLSDEDVEALLATALGGPVDPATVATLALKAAGNVLFLQELVIGAQAQGSLRCDAGMWRLAGEFVPSNRLIELIEARIGALDNAERGLLELVSYSEPLGSAALATLSDPKVCARLEDKKLVSVGLDGRRVEIRASHPVYAEVIRRQLPVMREQQHARALAETVEASGGRRRDDVLRMATWRLVGGGGGPDLMYEAAEIASWRHGFALAEQLARRAVSLGAGFDARLLLAQLAGLQGRTVECDADLHVLEADADDDASRAKLLLARIDMAALGTQRETAIAMAEEAEQTISDPGWRDEIAARRAVLLLGARGFDTVAGAAVPLMARSTGRPFVLACYAGALTLARLGRISEALEAADRGYDAHGALREPLEWYTKPLHLVARGFALSIAGRFAEVDALAVEQHRQSVIDGSTIIQALFALLKCMAIGDRGHVREVERRGVEAVALSREIGQGALEVVCVSRLLVCYALERRTGDMAKLMETLESVGPPPPSSTVEVAEARAWAAAARGDLPAARQVLEEVIAIAPSIGDLVGQAVSLHTLARFGAAPQALERLVDVAASIEGELTANRVEHVRGLVDGDASRLEAVSDSFEAMGATLLAAEAAADAAVVWRRAGNARRGAADEQRATAVADRCGGVHTPALESVAGRVRLTPAERDTALLAATGRTNRQIADQLFLSVRTVENRLQHVYGKLGVASRAELADALRDEVSAT